MADLYWNAPSSPAYYSTASNWRIGSPSGTVSSSAPTAGDNVYFSPGGTTVGCTFDVSPTVNAFFANDPSGGSFINPSLLLTITCVFRFDISQAGLSQAMMFSTITGGPSTPSVTVVMQASAGNQEVNIGPHQIGGLLIDNTSGGLPVDLLSHDGATAYPFKCYALRIQSGNTIFSPTYCNGAQLGYPGTTSLTQPALEITATGRLNAQFPASKKFILYGSFYANATLSTPMSSLTWAPDTVMEFRGSQGNITVEITPIPAYFGVPQQPRWLPFVCNYMGENADGTPTSTLGGTLSFQSGGGGGARPIKMFGLTCTATGSSGFGTYSRFVVLGYGATPSFYDLLISYATPFGTVTPIFNVNGNTSAQVGFLGAGGSGTPSKFKFETSTPPATAQTTYTTLSYINADTSSGTQYLAYLTDGNVNGGGNNNWQFVAAAGGLLAFFF